MDDLEIDICQFFPRDILITVSEILDVKSLLLFATINKSLLQFYSVELLALLRIKLCKLTRFDTHDLSLILLQNLYRLRTADVIMVGPNHSLILNCRGYVSLFERKCGIDDQTCDFDVKNIASVNNIINIFQDSHFCYLLTRNEKLYVIPINSKLDAENIKQFDSSGLNINKIRYFTIYPFHQMTLFISKDNKVYISKDQSPLKYARDSISDYPEFVKEFVISKNINIFDDILDIVGTTYYLFVLTTTNVLNCFSKSSPRTNNYNRITFGIGIYIIGISGCDSGVALLRSDGKVYWCSGDDLYEGEFEIIKHLTDIISISVSNCCALALDNKGNTYFWTLNNPKCVTQIPSLSNIIKIFSGNYYMLAIDYNGNVYYNKYPDMNDIFNPAYVPNIIINIVNIFNCDIW